MRERQWRDSSSSGRHGSDVDEMRGAALDSDALVAIEAWAKSWFTDSNGLDRLSFQDLPVGWALHVDVFQAICRIVLPLLGRPAQPLGNPILRTLKYHGLDRGLRAWSLRLAGRAVAQQPAPLAFFSELATPSTLGPAIAVASQLPSGLSRVVCADARAARKWMAHGHAVTSLVVGLQEERRILRSAGRDAENRWTAIRNSVPPLVIQGRDLRHLALTAVEPIIRRSVPWMAVERRAVDHVLDQVRPHTVILASDQHRIGRLVTHVARHRGIRSVVLQHGLPQATLGYVPVVADRLIAWSQASADWFVTHGTASGQVQIAGNPRMDELIARDAVADRQSVANRTGLSGSPNILVALSVAANEVNARVIEVAVKALRAFPNGTLLVKLHPGGGDWRVVADRLRLGKVSADRIHVTASADLFPLLYWSDVVVVHRSTVAVEALAAGRAVVAVAAAQPSIAQSELRDIGLVEVATPSELAAYIETVTSAGEGVATASGRRQAVARIVGPLDGQSVARTISLVLDPSS